MQNYFDDEVGEFKEKLLTMGSYAESAVSQAVQAVIERNDQLARQVQENDDIMDQYEIEIDDMAIHLLSKAPLAFGFAPDHRGHENFAKPRTRRRRGHHHRPPRGGIEPGTAAQSRH